MGKGSKPAGNVTMTNLTGQKQEPYLEDIWKGAQGLYNQYTPGSLTANEGIPWQQMGLQLQGDLAKQLHQEYQPTVYRSWLDAAGQRPSDSPAYNYYQGLAGGTLPAQQVLGGVSNSMRNAADAGVNNIAAYAPMAAGYGEAAARGNLGLGMLGQTASGAFLNKNPYLDAMVQNALDPITRNYQTTVAPQLDASFSGAGRYGSGAMLGQRENAQTTLAKQLADTSENLYGQNYARERAAQDTASQAYGGLYNQAQQLGMQGETAAANIYNSAGNQYLTAMQQAANAAGANLTGQQAGAAGLQGGYQAGQQNQLNAATLYPSLAQANFIPSQQVQGVGQGVNQLQQQYIDEPYTALQRYQQSIGQPIGAGTSQPYFQNQGANIMSGITGGLDIMSKLGGMGGMMGGWIICTELMRQGRMPWRYWAVGSRAFAAYPEAVRRGYYVWAIPTVRHLRRRPGSLYSRITAAVFRWRAEDLAARRGSKGARRLLRGRMVTWLLYPLCAAIGACVPAQDWQQVYDADRRTAR